MTPWNAAHRILCVRLDSMGDVLMTGPAIRALAESEKERHITLLTSTAGASIAQSLPEVDDVLVYDPPWMKSTPFRSTPDEDIRMHQVLKEREFNAAVIFTVYSQNPLPAAMMAYLAGIPLRLAHCRENPYQLLTHWVKETEPEQGTRHEVRRQLDLVGEIGAKTSDEKLSVHVSSQASASAQTLLKVAGMDRTRPWIVIHPGASAPSRRYPAVSYAQVAQQLALRSMGQILFTGQAEEKELIESIRSQMRGTSFSLVGKLDLPELTAVIKEASLLISNNTGPVHLAAAMGTPVVDLYALTNPQHTPWMVENRVLFQDVPCKYCYKSICPEGHQNCLRLVTPDQVVTAAEELLHPTGRLSHVYLRH
jgi:lipopolysaccharide heptosyltransferase II